MKPATLDLDTDLVIIGLPLRTAPDRAATDIPAHWQRFVAEGHAAGGGPVYAVYCDYESDASGPYTMVLGVAALPTAPVPPGSRRVRIPRGTYATFAAAGDPAQVVWQTWHHINTAWAGRHQRRYIADFERYDTPVSAAIAVGLAAA